MKRNYDDYTKHYKRKSNYFYLNLCPFFNSSVCISIYYLVPLDKDANYSHSFGSWLANLSAPSEAAQYGFFPMPDD